MSECKKCRDMFVDALYEDLSAGEKKIFESHLQECSKCRQDFNAIASTGEAMSARTRPEPPSAFWDDYWNRLVERLKKEQVTLPEKEKWWLLIWPKKISQTPRWVYQTVASVLLVVAGVIIGRMFFLPAPVSVQKPGLAGTASSPASQVNVAQRAFDYIERSKLIVLAISNFDPEKKDPYALDLPYQQQISRELVQEASALKQELAHSRQRRLQELVSDLEVILLQIANLEPESDVATIELVQDGVKSRGILFKIYLADTLQSKESPDTSLKTGRAKNKSNNL